MAAEAPQAHPDVIVAPRRSARPVVLYLLGLGAGVVAVLALSVALAGPADAAPAPFVPTSSAAPPSAGPSALPASGRDHLVASGPVEGWASLLGAAAPVTDHVGDALQPVVHGVGEVVPAPVQGAGARALGAVAPVPGALAALASGATHPLDALLSPPGLTGTFLAAAPSPGALAPSPSSWAAPAPPGHHVTGAPLAPSPTPRPRRHAPVPVPDPLSLPAGTTTGESPSPGHGGTPLEGLPPMTLLLPALVLAGLVFVRRSELMLAFEARYVPPG